MLKKRNALIERKTNEVSIKVGLGIDGSGKTKIVTGFEPLNHLLTLFAFHGLFNLSVKAEGDLQHHIIEDIGIALGKAFKKALAGKEGINRYGSFSVTMDDVVVEANIDISGRPKMHQEITAEDSQTIRSILKSESFDNENFTYKDACEFLEAFVQHTGISLVYVIKSGPGDLHHILEALFKAMGKALDQATMIDQRRKGVPSTKGVID